MDGRGEVDFYPYSLLSLSLSLSHTHTHTYILSPSLSDHLGPLFILPTSFGTSASAFCVLAPEGIFFRLVTCSCAGKKEEEEEAFGRSPARANERTNCAVSKKVEQPEAVKRSRERRERRGEAPPLSSERKERESYGLAWLGSDFLAERRRRRREKAAAGVPPRIESGEREREEGDPTFVYYAHAHTHTFRTTHRQRKEERPHMYRMGGGKQRERDAAYDPPAVR